MSWTTLAVVLFALAVVWLVLYMRAQKPADENLLRGDALKNAGRFDEAAEHYARSSDPAAREGLALSLAHAGRDLDRAKRLMEETIALHPQIQEFQALVLAYILLRRGDRDAALRGLSDNLELLETRFTDDYTDPDPQLAETLYLFAVLSDAAGDTARASAVLAQAAAWAPGSHWARATIAGAAR
jgi:tetratricopeptide (TPR) repeat protein